jgi:hypothetical protein
MYCTQCGTSRPEGMTICANCGTAAPRFPEPEQVKNYLVQSILVTLCCCVPAGIVAIIYAAQVNTKLAARDVAGAQESARLAKVWSWVGFIFAVLGWGIYALVVFAGAAAGSCH